VVVQPDFLDHYKTQTLIESAGEFAPLAVIGLWVHCHNRRTDTFDLTAAKLARICRWSGDADQLFEAMTDNEDGFLDLNNDGTFTVHDWWETNKSMTSYWGNSSAKKGKKKRIENDTKTNPSTQLNSTPNSSSSKARASSASEVADYLESIEMPRSDGETLFDKWEGSGWMNGKNKIKCWKATARSWKSQGYLASQQRANGSNGSRGGYDASTGTF
jgi:hypothetical protein